MIYGSISHMLYMTISHLQLFVFGCEFSGHGGGWGLDSDLFDDAITISCNARYSAPHASAFLKLQRS